MAVMHQGRTQKLSPSGTKKSAKVWTEELRREPSKFSTKRPTKLNYQSERWNTGIRDVERKPNKPGVVSQVGLLSFCRRDVGGSGCRSLAIISFPPRGGTTGRTSVQEGHKTRGAQDTRQAAEKNRTRGEDHTSGEGRSGKRPAPDSISLVAGRGAHLPWDILGQFSTSSRWAVSLLDLCGAALEESRDRFDRRDRLRRDNAELIGLSARVSILGDLCKFRQILDPRGCGSRQMPLMKRRNALLVQMAFLRVKRSEAARNETS